MKALRKFAAVATTVGLMLTGGVAAATSASAAPYVACSGHGFYALNSIGNYGYYVPVSAYGRDCYLKPGSQNSGVKILQTALNACEGGNLATDGVYGAGTKAAIVRIQKRAGLPADGVYGTNTRMNI